MTKYAKNVNSRTAVKTPQTEQARPDQVLNNAGGYVFAVDLWTRLDRFVLLGSEANTYYVDAKTLTKDNYNAVIECVKVDGLRTVNRIVELSVSGRAKKNTPAVFALAVCAIFGDKMTKEAAFRKMPEVARTGTDFFGFIDSYKQLDGGFGSVARKGIAAWYMDKDISDAAYQIIKYRQRDGWTHLDALRLSHAKPRTAAESNLFSFAKTLAGKDSKVKVKTLPKIAQGYLAATSAKKASEIVKLITEYNLPREAIPTDFLNDVEVWDALLQKMPATALIRNLAKMTSIGLLSGSNDNVKLVEANLLNEDWLRKSRLHPVTLLNALYVYNMGHGVLGSLTWSPVRRIVDALDAAFYLSFGHIAPTGKKLMLALDTSGSMSGGYGGFSRSVGFSLPPREITAAMSMATAKVESDYLVTYFSGSNGGYGHGNSGIAELSISPRQRLDDVVKAISNLPWGNTDCALPMTWALSKKIEIDTFVIYTDNETYAGKIHPFEAIKQYRKAMNPNAKLIVCGTVSTGFSIADPSDDGMLDVVGFDANVPDLISEFVRK
jgi:60 kDa SS-A/Ro ribonucleoprotein